MKRLSSFAVASALLAGAGASVAYADAESPHSFSANATLATDYIYRGASQTDENPAIQGGFDYGHSSGLYLGLWASNVNFNENASETPATQVDEATIEIDFYGGYNHEFTPSTSADIGLIGYVYPGASSTLGYDYYEAYAGLSHVFSGMNFQGVDLAPTLGIKLYYSPDFTATDTDDAVYVDSSLDLSLPYEFGFNVHGGRQNIDGAKNYWDWKVGVSKSVFGFDLELAYTDTDLDENDLADARAVFSVSRDF